MKVGHYLVSIIFFLFAVLQLNDSDPFLWIVLYVAVAVIPLFYVRGMTNSFLLGAFSFVLILFSATYMPSLVGWVGEGMPSITETMKAESPHVEFVREVLGLLLALGVVVLYYFKSKSLEN